LVSSTRSRNQAWTFAIGSGTFKGIDAVRSRCSGILVLMVFDHLLLLFGISSSIWLGLLVGEAAHFSFQTSNGDSFIAEEPWDEGDSYDGSPSEVII